jgi:hypothetical protein
VINLLSTLKCRFGCAGGVAVIVELEKGCVCWPDQIQALCPQHWTTLEPLGECRVIFDWQPADAGEAKQP